MKQNRSALIQLIFSMTIFGTIGIFVSYIDLSSSLIALVRAIIGFLFLLVVVVCKREPISISAIRQNLLWLCLSGAFIGFNWILLFESYRYTSVAVSTLCYYMAPILVILVSPLVLKEKLTAQKIICVPIALLGMVFISGVIPGGISGFNELKGIALGLGAALLYASIMLMNKQLKNIGAYDKTIFQLGFSAIFLIPYCLLTCDFSEISLGTTDVVCLLIVSVLHTGFTYFLYFGTMEHLPGQTIAMISYIDPVIAVLCSIFILQQTPKPFDIPGAVLILGAAVISELNFRKRGKA